MFSPVDVTADTLAKWPLPEPDEDKYGRGQVVVVGGALRSPGAAMLAGQAALRVGAGRLTLAVGESVAAQVGVAVPESGVVALDETARRSVRGAALLAAKDDLARADVVLLGPGLDDAEEAAAMERVLPELIGDGTIVVLDAFGLGALPGLSDVTRALSGRLVLTPNKVEAALLIERDLGDLAADAVEIARRYNAVVSCFGVLADSGGALWRVDAGGPGLATSGSGDVLAGAIAGLCARGATPAQAAVWGTFVHASAGDRLAADVAPLGFLASELASELPAELARVASAPHEMRRAELR